MVRVRCVRAKHGIELKEAADSKGVELNELRKIMEVKEELRKVELKG